MDTIFLACFIFGALFTVASLVLGFGHSGHLAHGAHAGHGGLGHGAHAGHGGDLGHAPHAAHAGSAADANHDFSHVHIPRGDHADALAHVPWVNASSAVGALTWFGAAGYLLLRLGDLAAPAAIVGGLLAGGIGWYLVARFLGLVLSGEREMDPDDYRLEGTVGNLTIGIPAGGTGEVVFQKAGARRSEAARALDGVAVRRGEEVVITAYADGFATVQPWGEFVAARDRAKAAAQNREV